MDEEREPIPLNPSNEAFRQLTPYFGGMCCEAAAYCFSKNGHRIPTSTALTGCDPSRAAFEWTVPPAEADATYRDRDVTAENGAYTLAIALLHRLHGYRVIERSAKGRLRLLARSSVRGPSLQRQDQIGSFRHLLGDIAREFTAEKKARADGAKR